MVELIDNVNRLLGDDMKSAIRRGSKIRIAASCFSIYAFEALKRELDQVDELRFIFTAPTFTPGDVTDSGRKAHREYHIPKAERERTFYGSEFEIQLKNKLTQRAVAKECADWMIYAHLATLQLAVYAPVSYILPSRLGRYEELYDTEVSSGGGTLKQADREKSLQALMTTNLLKRLESSVEAFRITLGKLKNNHHQTLGKIEKFKRDGQDVGFDDVSAGFETSDDEDEDFPEPDDPAIGGKVRIRLSDMDLPSWERDLKADVTVIRALLAEMEKVTPQDDAKLQHLKTQIASKLASPLNPGNKKVLIFTAFADTAFYLYKHLSADATKQKLHSAVVTGAGSPKSTLKTHYDFQSILTLFSPRSKEKAAILPNEPGEIDILIGTDCISEGQNLQDCDYLINYDIHWNPVRIIQRFGRIDRIGSTNGSIQLVNYWPDISLDEYINLKERVENRMVIADAVATADDNVLKPQTEQQANDVSYRREQLRRLQDEVIDMEDVKTGVSITDLGLNDFRMDLLNYVKNHEDLASVPSGMHAVVPADPDRGLPPGAIFTLRNRNHGVNINQQNRLHPFYLIYVGHDGQVIANHTEVNLDALKLLQETYLNKVKMIYIDPPYNTGREFIYDDDFAEEADEYLLRSGQASDSGARLVANTEANGRYHSDWLSMMYPRLRLARNLLRDDGVLFISIDDNEVGNLRRLCDEVFGEANFVATIVWQKVYAPKNTAQWFSEDHDFVLVYARHKASWKPQLLPRTEAMEARYSNPDDDPRGPWKAENMAARNRYDAGVYPITCPSGRVIEGPPRGAYWRINEAKFKALAEDNRIWWGEDGNNTPAVKRFLSEVSSGRTPQTLWFYKEVGHTQDAKKTLLKYVPFQHTENVLNSVKPVELIQRMLQLAGPADEEAIVLDFFSGSAATAHAVLKQNAEDGGRRRFIGVQLPEALPEPEPELASIFEMGTTRIRNVIKELKETEASTLTDLRMIPRLDFAC